MLKEGTEQLREPVGNTDLRSLRITRCYTPLKRVKWERHHSDGFMTCVTANWGICLGIPLNYGRL